MIDLVGGRISRATFTVLVVEDEVLLRLLICDSLSDAGVSVVEAGSGDEAREKLVAGTAVDLVLTDLRMPGATGGLELAEVVNASLASPPVIIMSGNPEVAALSGRYPFLLKPFAMDEMVEAVLAALPATPIAPTAAASEPRDGSTAIAAPDRPSSRPMQQSTAHSRYRMAVSKSPGRKTKTISF